MYLDSKINWSKSILEEILKIYQSISTKSIYYEIDISLKISIIWKIFITNGFTLTNKKSEGLYSDRIKLMLSWIHMNYDKKIMLEDIARAGQLSRSECCRYFKRFLSISPLNYVINYRIEKSLFFLQQSDTNITEVAYIVGFNSTSYYINKFRKSMGMIPLEYKKQKAENHFFLIK